MKIFKAKYKFNPETLQYEKIRFSFKKTLLKSIPHLALSIGLGIAFMSLYMMLYDSPKEQYLKYENQFLKTQFKEMSERLNAGEALLTELAKRDNYFYRITYNQDTIPLTLRQAGVGGTDRYRHLEGYESTDIVKEVATKLDNVEKQLDIQTISYSELFEAVKIHEQTLGAMPFLQPIHPADLTRIGSFYGYRFHPILRVRQMHEGIDLTAPVGTPVYAPGDGVVVRIEYNRSRRGYGNLIVIDHEVNGVSSRYAHLSTINVKKGERVKRGQQIGTVGNTGLSTSPHLHYEIRINGASINPLRYMLTPLPDQYDELIKLAQYPGISFD
jgi:murein DD-endopeptidase MepM/ murein hydrolase activator NlpD